MYKIDGEVETFQDLPSAKEFKAQIYNVKKFTKFLIFVYLRGKYVSNGVEWIKIGCPFEDLEDEREEARWVREAFRKTSIFESLKKFIKDLL